MTKPTLHSSFIRGYNIWLLKPTGLNRGRGIEIFNNLEQFKQYVQEYYDGFTVPDLKKD